MTKESLIAFIAEKARISTQRAELAYEAFWEAILSELKTGHFSLPVGKGTLQVKDKTPSGSKTPVPVSKVPEKKVAKKSAVKVAKKPTKATKAKKDKPKSTKPVVKKKIAKKVSKGKKRK